MILFPSIPFVWPFLLAASLIVAFKVSFPAGVLFSLQILSFQFVKYVDLPQQQIIFLGVLTLFSCASYTYSASIAAITFAAIAVLYSLFIFGYIGQTPKVIAADILLVIGLICSGYSGYDGGLLGRGGSVFGNRSADYNSVSAEILQKEEES